MAGAFFGGKRMKRHMRSRGEAYGASVKTELCVKRDRSNGGEINE